MPLPPQRGGRVLLFSLMLPRVHLILFGLGTYAYAWICLEAAVLGASIWTCVGVCVQTPTCLYRYAHAYIRTYIHEYIYGQASGVLSPPQWYGMNGLKGVGPGTHGGLRGLLGPTLTPTLKLYPEPRLKLVCCNLVWQAILYYSMP